MLVIELTLKLQTWLKKRLGNRLINTFILHFFKKNEYILFFYCKFCAHFKQGRIIVFNSCFRSALNLNKRQLEICFYSLKEVWLNNKTMRKNVLDSIIVTERSSRFLITVYENVFYFY